MEIKRKFSKLFLIYMLIILLILYSNSYFSTIKICKAIESNIIFVGGSGDKNYSKIQEAIDDSNENDTIIVFEGIYNESIVINKSINLIGLNKNNVSINGNDSLYVFLIKSSYANLSGFTIQGGKIGIFLSGPEFNYNNFSGNNISNNTEGIRFVNTSNNSIFNNTIQSDYNFGIVLYGSCNNNISENFLINNDKSIFLNKWSNNNIIQKNNLTENKKAVSLDFSFYNLISENYIGNNTIGVYLTNSLINNITNNHIEFNKDCGIFISNSDDNLISSNIFLKNNQDIKLDTEPPELKAPGFEFCLFFVAILLFLCLKKYF